MDKKFRKSLTILQVFEQFRQLCAQHKVKVCPEIGNVFIHILVRDARDGLDLQNITACRLENFLMKAVQRYGNPVDATVCNTKLCCYFDQCTELDIDAVKELYTKKFEKQIKELVDGILQYPENSSKTQIEEMFMKMQVFIVANYNLGCPKNHVLLKQTRQSLNSVIGRGDLQNYVLKKKHHRMEYLQRLGATVCGILVYNNNGPAGDKENMRDIFVDLEMAKTNTKHSLDAAIKHCQQLKKYGFRAINEVIKLDVGKKMAHCHWPVEKVMEVNKFIALYCVHERCLKCLRDVYDKTHYLIEVGESKLKCVIHKIDDVLKYRTAIDSELIFPHFVHLSEIWSSLVLYLNHLAELNKIKSKMDEYVSPAVENQFGEVLEATHTCSVQMKHTIEPTFQQLVARSMKKPGIGSLIKIQENIENFCALTIALTGGLLVPANLTKKLCEDLNMRFGFGNMELAKYAERNFEEFISTFQNVAFSTADLILLFGLHNEILRQDCEANYVESGPLVKSLETQTELMDNEIPISERIKFTWNIWDFHRETIRLANMRRRQTHSAQTVVTYGRRNAQNQFDQNRHDV